MDNTVLLSLRGLKAWAGCGYSGSAVTAEAGMYARALVTATTPSRQQEGAV